MPFFKTVEGEFTQLCVYAAQEEPCPDPNCKLNHEPKERRICPMFHDPKERCPHKPCLLGHHEAREAFRASRALARCNRLTELKDEDLTEGTKATEQGADTGGHSETTQTPTNDPKPTVQEANRTLNLTADQPPNNQPKVQNGAKVANPVNFETLIQDNARTGQQDEIKRLCQVTENLKTEIEGLKKADHGQGGSSTDDADCHGYGTGREHIPQGRD
jgi:hypothetical protein